LNNRARWKRWKLPPIKQDILVSLDLETTGLNPKSERIIEVGAVKFRGETEIETFSALVNPNRKLSKLILQMTGITQREVDDAPDWDEIKASVMEFVSGAPIIGHNVGFDASFLRSHGVKTNRLYDTMSMAEIALPGGPEYSLVRLSERFGVQHDNPHRALSDALATRDLFLHLAEIIGGYDRAVLEQIQRLGSYSRTPLSDLASRMLETGGAASIRTVHTLSGIDPKEISSRIRSATRTPRIKPHEYKTDENAPSDHVKNIFGESGELERSLPDFEHRPEQIAMAEAVSDAINSERHLVVEAGTGVGKSLAYLIPSALYAAEKGERVVISTNTINLQEQLISKDIPIATSTLNNRGAPIGNICASQLKGRANYLCIKRWQNSIMSTEHNEIESRLLSKILVWLKDTETGDKYELALGQMSRLFNRFSAQGALDCPSNVGPCFLKKARSDASHSNIVIINHALLMSNIAMGGGLLPEHDVLIVDEAHHLESAATSHFGFSVNQFQLENELRSLIGPTGLCSRLTRVISKSDINLLDSSDNRALAITDAVEIAIETSSDIFRLIVEIVADSEQQFELRVTKSVRNQLDVPYQDMDDSLSEVFKQVVGLCEQASRSKEKPDEGLVLDAYSIAESIETARSNLSKAIWRSTLDDDSVYWLRTRPDGRGTTINGAPLDVSKVLRNALFEDHSSVVLTGSTITYENSFKRYRDSIGMEDGEELVLGSPYDYEKNTLVVVPEDLPAPGEPGFAKASANALIDIAKASAGRILVLFTSISALDNAHKSISPVLNPFGIRVIAQGIDGSPARIMRMLAGSTPTIALGTSSLWEGVDLEGESIDVLVMARLPFPVPSDPIVAARSELLEEDGGDSFNDYIIPEAVQRFRQGFGRLIRSQNDRGVFVVLDNRIVRKQYGVKFQKSLPKCNVRRLSVERLSETLGNWRNNTLT
jgi:DNA polymerase-3 subunit epsilon/ATP-dependent DNA helicase DinG